MPNYEVEVKETLARVVPIRADNEFEAMNLVEERYYNSQIILDADDIAGVRFFVLSGCEEQDYDEMEMRLR